MHWKHTFVTLTERLIDIYKQVSYMHTEWNGMVLGFFDLIYVLMQDPKSGRNGSMEQQGLRSPR